ncbi:MAG: hypothetical protein D8M25_12050 [Bacteroidetes bacterium]|nr:hypothetical protein [Bacteroidota bacterium]
MLGFLFLSACSDETIVNEVSGTIYKNCDNSTYGYAEIALKTNRGGSFSDPIILGGDVANGDGYFQFTYELKESEKGTAELILSNPDGYTVLLDDLPLNRDIKTNIYIENKSPVSIKLSGSRVFQITDTLFIGVKNTSIKEQVVQPTNGVIATLKINVPNEYKSTTQKTIYYGVGTSDFQKSKDALSIPDSVYQHVSLQLKGCDVSEQVDLTIN